MNKIIDFEFLKDVQIMLGIKFIHITIYRAELIYLRKDGIKYKDIALLLDVNASIVPNWFNKQSQPKEIIIDKLEDMYFKRLGLLKSDLCLDTQIETN